MIKKGIRLTIATIILIFLYFISQIAFFHDEEFERAVRDTMNSSVMPMSHKRDKPIEGIIWKKDLEKVDYISINFRYYNVKSISDIKYFKNVRIVWFSYSRAYREDTSIYKEEHILDKLYLIKNFKHLEKLYLRHLIINEDIEAMFPNVKVFID